MIFFSQKAGDASETSRRCIGDKVAKAFAAVARAPGVFLRISSVLRWQPPWTGSILLYSARGFLDRHSILAIAQGSGVTILKFFFFKFLIT